MNDRPQDDLATRLAFALDAARDAGRLTLEYFDRPGLQVERKDDASPVTVADREAEGRLRARIAERYPDDSILGEELPQRSGTSAYRWILDPIDGTKSFIHGVPLYATLVALQRDGESVLGVIHLPALEQTVAAAIGQGAWHWQGEAERVPAQVSQTTTLAEGLFLTSEVQSFDDRRARDVYHRLASAARLSRTWGDAYGYLLVATGRADVMVDPAMRLWDAAALLPILREAGGTFTDWQGNVTVDAGEGIATNGRLLDEVLAITGG